MSKTVTQTLTSALRSTSLKVTLNITSDTICPWCYIGFVQINRAIEMAKENKLPLTFEVEFSPFMLDPTLPKVGGQPKMERYIEKFGEARANQAVANLDRAGRELGIAFRFGGLTSQTTLTHRLLMKAFQDGGQELQQPLLKEIFAGYFEQDRDVGDIDWLSSCAEKVGVMSASDAAAFLESDELEAEVEQLIEMAQAMDITGVPFTIINRKWALSGAQPSDVFYQVFQKLAKEPKSKMADISDGDMCS